MSKTTFKVTKRADSTMIRTIRAIADSPGRTLIIYLDEGTGEPMYPISIESVIPGVIITLVSDTEEVCSFSPSVSSKQVKHIIEYLNMFDDMVSAARKLIEKEQQLLKNTRNK